MTCVIGIRTGQGALIGFDSCAGANGNVLVRADKKGAQLRPWLAFGYTWSYRMGQIIEHHLVVPTKPKQTDSLRWVIRDFIPAIRTALREQGWLKKEHEREEAGQFVLAVGFDVFRIHTDLQVEQPESGYAACGSGEQLAMGALHARAQSPPEDAVRAALEAAAACNAYVLPPWHFLTTEPLR